jgi:hypothetical protein
MQVIDEVKTGDGLVGGTIVNGSRPYGRLCGSHVFNYTVRYGPFQTCGSYRVSARASISARHHVACLL